MNGKIKYEFLTKIWKYPGSGGWYFVSMPTDTALEIRENMKWREEGWGRMKATAEIGSSMWETAIWFDKKQRTYILPLKAAIREKEKIEQDEEIRAVVWI
ncbi:MAG: DUF1905 domain-containing protein [Bacteroidia bacterium]